MSAELLVVEQRESPTAGAAWVLEGGRRIPGHDDGRRVAEIRTGLLRHSLVRVQEADASDDEVERILSSVHEPGYLRMLRSAPATEPVVVPELAPPGLEPDMPLAAGPVAAAQEGVRTALTAAQLVCSGATCAYALSRPPGHHAGPGWLAGYCYLNTAAAAAKAMCDSGIESVGVLDLDLHYPNGTAAIVASMERVQLHSLHAWPVTNVPELTVRPRTAREQAVEFQEPPAPKVYLDHVARALDTLANSCSALVLSLGYDTIAGDPHGSWSFSPQIFFQIGRLVAETDLPVCVVQEGGYALGLLAQCSQAFAGGVLAVASRSVAA